MKQIAIIGGGYAGAAAGMAFAAVARAACEIVVVEPRETVGAGTAYDTVDPALRLNVEDTLMVVDIQAIDDFSRWLEVSGARAADPEGIDAAGEFYARRGDFGRYMAGKFRAATRSNTSGSVIRHCRDAAVALGADDSGPLVDLRGGNRLRPDLVVLALGNEAPAPVPGLQSHTGYIANPWDPGALADITSDSRIAVIGTGLTAVDMIASLTRRGHFGHITAISRRGLLPRAQGQFPGIAELLRRNMQPVPAFIANYGMPSSVSQVLRHVRDDIAAGTGWHDAVDAVRDAAKLIWPQLPLAEKQRFLRHLKPFYDSHRFRLAPQIAEVLAERRAAGTLDVLAARALAGKGQFLTLKKRHEAEQFHVEVDHVINCTGPNPDPAKSGLAVLGDAIGTGLLARDPSGVGLAVNEDCETLRSDGSPNLHILALGPMTRGRFAETVAVPQITMQLVPLTARLIAQGRL